MNLYKYLSYDSLCKTLHNNSLKYSQPCIFNDPFDSHIPVKQKVDKTILRQEIEKNIAEYVNKNYQIAFDNRFQHTLAEAYRNGVISRGQLKHPKKLIKTLLENSTSNNFSYIFDEKKPIENNLMCCFSKNKESILMWSHYAINHTGAVIEFDSELIPGDCHYDMRYTNDIPEIDLKKVLFDRNDEDLWKYINSNTLCKAKCWEYEEEVRYLCHYHNFNSLPVSPFLPKNIDNIETDHFAIIPFKKDALKSIYLGVNCNIDRNELNFIRSNYSNANLFTCRLSKSRFGLAFDKI